MNTPLFENSQYFEYENSSDEINEEKCVNDIVSVNSFEYEKSENSLDRLNGVEIVNVCDDVNLNDPVNVDVGIRMHLSDDIMYKSSHSSQTW